MRNRAMVPYALAVLALAGIVVVLVVHPGAGPAPGGEAGRVPLAPAGAAGPGAGNVASGFRHAVARLSARLEADPGDRQALEAMGRLWQDAHRPDSAVRYYERYVALDSTNRQVWLDLAATRAALGRWHEARQAMEALLERAPDDPAALYNLGAIHASLGEMRQALLWWERAAAQTADTAVAARAREALTRLPAEGAR